MSNNLLFMGSHRAQPTKGSWRGKLIQVVVLGTCVLVFINSVLARRGFDVIATLPDWYQNILYVTILAGLGLKGLDKFRRKQRLGGRFLPKCCPLVRLINNCCPSVAQPSRPAENRQFRQAHNLKVVGSNPTLATKNYILLQQISHFSFEVAFCVLNYFCVHYQV